MLQPQGSKKRSSLPPATKSFAAPVMLDSDFLPITDLQGATPTDVVGRRIRVWYDLGPEGENAEYFPPTPQKSSAASSSTSIAPTAAPDAETDSQNPRVERRGPEHTDLAHLDVWRRHRLQFLHSRRVAIVEFDGGVQFRVEFVDVGALDAHRARRVRHGERR